LSDLREPHIDDSGSYSLLVGWAIHSSLAVWILEQKTGESDKPEFSREGSSLKLGVEITGQHWLHQCF